MIGVVGGGQLAMLLVEAGKRRDVDVVVQTSAKTDPAAKKTKLVVLNDPTNAEGTKLLAEKSRLITFENCLLYTSPSPRDRQKSRMPSSA